MLSGITTLRPMVLQGIHLFKSSIADSAPSVPQYILDTSANEAAESTLISQDELLADIRLGL